MQYLLNVHVTAFKRIPFSMCFQLWAHLTLGGMSQLIGSVPSTFVADAMMDPFTAKGISQFMNYSHSIPPQSCEPGCHSCPRRTEEVVSGEDEAEAEGVSLSRVTP